MLEVLDLNTYLPGTLTIFQCLMEDTTHEEDMAVMVAIHEAIVEDIAEATGVDINRA